MHAGGVQVRHCGGHIQAQQQQLQQGERRVQRAAVAVTAVQPPV